MSHIITGNEGGLFYIAPFDGSLYANQSLDREAMSSHTISVMASHNYLLFII